MAEDGTAGCRARFEETVARDFSDPRFFNVHRLVVDTYCLQHPDEYCVSAKSLAAHLASLCLILEEGASAATGACHLNRWLDGAGRIDKPSLPAERGRIILQDLSGIGEPSVWRQAVRRWADSTWEAYAISSRSPGAGRRKRARRAAERRHGRK
jgi:hypothetical protein